MTYSERVLTRSEVIAFARDVAASLTFVSQDIDVLTCIVCQRFRHKGMLAHVNCGRFLCSTCILQLLDNEAEISCPACGNSLACSSRHSLRTSETSLRHPTLVEQKLADETRYNCNYCAATNLSYDQAKSHSCPDIRTRIPPSHLNIIARQPAAERTELVSDPPPTLARRRCGRHKLIIINLDGQQVLSRCLPETKPVARVIKEAADFLQISDTSSWEVFKFTHTKVCPSTLIRDVAINEGANHLNIFSDKPSLASRTANLLLEDIGPPSLLPRESNPPPPNALLEESWD